MILITPRAIVFKLKMNSNAKIRLCNSLKFIVKGLIWLISKVKYVCYLISKVEKKLHRLSTIR